MNTSRAGQTWLARASSAGVRGLRQQASAPPHTFEADITASEEPPHRAAAARDPAFAHRRDDLVQHQVRLVKQSDPAETPRDAPAERCRRRLALP